MSQPLNNAAALRRQLMQFLPMREHDPHANAAKLLAYRLSDELAAGQLSLPQMENILADLCQSATRARGTRLAARAGLNEMENWRRQFKKIIAQKAKGGFQAFRKWAESEAVGLVATAHPTFAMTDEMRAHVLAAATGAKAPKKLIADTIIRDVPPRLSDEHEEAQSCIRTMHKVIDDANALIVAQAAKSFPRQWTKLTPQMVTVASWVGYDLDGRRDIQWSDTIRLKLNEKAAKLDDYCAMAEQIAAASKNPPKALLSFIEAAQKARALACDERDAFAQDLSHADNLAKAAKILTTPQKGRWLNITPALKYLTSAIQQTEERKTKQALMVLKAHIMRCGMGTARLHLRVNAQQVLTAIGAHVPVTGDDRLNSRTFLRRISKFAERVKPVASDFAMLDAQDSTVDRQLILAAQILNGIDRDMPIRFLIAECDQASIVLSALALARYYGVAAQLDISPLFETPHALRNGGRVVAQMLEQPAYRAHAKQRGVIAVQTGFSDAGRFMGQIAAVLAVERLQSHLATAIAESGLTDMRALIFNTHGESIGRGGHPGNLTQRMDYIMSPWVFERFRSQKIALTHEFSFQGGDGFLWFGDDRLGEASLLQLLCARFQPTQAAADDEFYADADFVWDFYNEVINQQDSLYHDDDYRYVLSGFARNFLIPSGSRPEIRQASGPLAQSTFTPRRIRAIPHNAILQQLAIPTNVIFGIGRAGRIDPNRFNMIFRNAPRGRTIMDMVLGSWRNTHLQILAAYGDFQDPNFWISRSIAQGNKPTRWQYRVVAHQLYQRNANPKLRQLLYRLRADGDLLAGIMHAQKDDISLNLSGDVDGATQNQILFHGIRLALLMHAQFVCAALPVNAPPGATRDEIMERICNFDLAHVIDTLTGTYPPSELAAAKAEKKGKTAKAASANEPQHILHDLVQCRRLVQMTSQGLAQGFNAYG
jgi:phosphoenolpyruvate carboxylase